MEVQPEKYYNGLGLSSSLNRTLVTYYGAMYGSLVVGKVCRLTPFSTY